MHSGSFVVEPVKQESVAKREAHAMLYLFDRYELDTGQRELRRDGKPIPVQPQVFFFL